VKPRSGDRKGLPFSEGVLVGNTIRRETRGHNDRVVQCVSEESGCKRGAEMIVCVSKNAVHKDKCSRDVFVLRLQWVRTVDEDTRRLS
jgi:hypothetical protein